MKFTKLTNKLGNVVIGIMLVSMILVILGIDGVFLWLDLSYPDYSLSFLWFILLPATGLGINWFIGPFFGDEYYETGWVNEGNSVRDVVKTPKYYTRRMFVCFVECFLFILLIIRFIFQKSIIGIIGSIIAIIIYFIVGMSSYEQSSIKIKKDSKINKKKEKIEESTTENTVVKKKQLNKFKFDKYPGLLEKYNTFKHWNSKKGKRIENVEDKKIVLNEIDKSFEDLAMSVFNIFNEIKPNLVIKKTGKKIKWEDVFNKTFEELSYMEKMALVRLLDRLYKYVLPSDYYNW